MIGTKCTPGCKMPTPSQAHCPTCHRTFGGVTGFDEHRYNGTCVHPQGLGQKETEGVWRRPMDEEAHERMRQLREKRGQK